MAEYLSVKKPQAMVESVDAGGTKTTTVDPLTQSAPSRVIEAPKPDTPAGSMQTLVMKAPQPAIMESTSPDGVKTATVDPLTPPPKPKVAEAPKAQPAVPGVTTPPPAPSPTPAPAPAQAEKPKPREKTAKETKADDAAADLLTQGMDYVKGMMEGDNPLVKREFNSWLSGFAKTSSMQRDSFMMQLRSQPGFVEGSGEGIAAMLMLARANGTDLSNMMSKMSIENVRQMGEWNKYGIDKALQIQNHLDQQVTNDINNELLAISAETARMNNDTLKLQQDGLALQNQGAASTNFFNEVDKLKALGHYDKAAELLNKKYPGVHIDAAALRTSDIASTGAISIRADAIKDLIEQGDAAGAKASNIDFHRQFWKELGFASPEAAAAFAEKIDYTAEAYSARTEMATKATADMRTFAAQNDSALGKKAVEEYFRVTGADAAAIGKGLTLEQVNEMRANEKLPPLASLTGEDMKSLGVDWEWYQQRKRVSGANEVETMFEQFAAVNPSLANDPEMERMTKAWLMKQSLNQNIIPDASAPGGFRMKEASGSVAPWDDPETSHYFTTWPAATFDDKGGFEVLGKGGIPYSFLNGQNYGPYSAAEDKRLDNAYNTWLYSKERDKSVTRDQWFYGTRGGTVSFNKANVPPGVSGTTTIPSRLDPAARESFLNDFKNTPATEVQSKMGDSDYVKNAVDMGATKNLTNMAALPADQKFWSEVQANNQGTIAINGTGYSVPNSKVLDTTYKGHGTVKQVEVVDASGKRWYLILSGNLQYDGVSYGPGYLKPIKVGEAAAVAADTRTFKKA